MSILLFFFFCLRMPADPPAIPAGQAPGGLMAERRPVNAVTDPHGYVSCLRLQAQYRHKHFEHLVIDLDPVINAPLVHL